MFQCLRDYTQHETGSKIILFSVCLTVYTAHLEVNQQVVFYVPGRDSVTGTKTSETPLSCQNKEQPAKTTQFMVDLISTMIMFNLPLQLLVYQTTVVLNTLEKFGLSRNQLLMFITDGATTMLL